MDLARGGVARPDHLPLLVDAIRITAASAEGPQIDHRVRSSGVHRARSGPSACNQHRKDDVSNCLRHSEPPFPGRGCSTAVVRGPEGGVVGGGGKFGTDAAACARTTQQDQCQGPASCNGSGARADQRAKIAVTALPSTSCGIFRLSAAQTVAKVSRVRPPRLQRPDRCSDERQDRSRSRGWLAQDVFRVVRHPLTTVIGGNNDQRLAAAAADRSQMTPTAMSAAPRAVICSGDAQPCPARRDRRRRGERT